ncbi:hypothetical protein AGMMS49990_06670 [Endomicrobiia bacterium]|nr:hypothetical protein AGMMS49990_06670 [Endomicrobiia bacterium]
MPDDDELDEDAPASASLLELELPERELVVDRPRSPGEKTLRFELFELELEITDDAPLSTPLPALLPSFVGGSATSVGGSSCCRGCDPPAVCGCSCCCGCASVETLLVL